MEVISHTTPDNQKGLHDYLRNRRLTGPIHLTTARMALTDLGLAIGLLKGSRRSFCDWRGRTSSWNSRASGRRLPSA